ncbi:hypothetical protein Ndes2526B_g00152 [Nannochloris sp. 'desiccata']|nr:hypothetical protein KSW81_002964 [Chlorella desiccata (nom. nud.)]KAH7624782.1 hypothetical protein NADE_002005 [Chlorella desiccata (nom. nud.)]
MAIPPLIEESATPTTPEAVVAAASTSFAHFSSLAARDAPELHINVPHHILRQDIVKCVEKTLRRPLEAKELAMFAQCFCLDASSLISWQEFSASLLKMEEMKIQNGVIYPKRTLFNSRARLLAARKKGLLAASSGTPDAASSIPLTSSQEIGWGHGPALAARVFSAQEQVKGTRQRAALKGSDVTAGGEGTSLASYYGPSLGRTF